MTAKGKSGLLQRLGQFSSRHQGTSLKRQTPVLSSLLHHLKFTYSYLSSALVVLTLLYLLHFKLRMNWLRHSKPQSYFSKMEGHNDNAARCLPKIPKLFTTTDHPTEVILFSASAPDEDSIKSRAVHGLTTCETHEDNTQQNDGQKERTPPSTALYSTLMSPGDRTATF